jgi:hypothetical protein
LIDWEFQRKIDAAGTLVDSNSVLLFQYELIENRQHLFAIAVHAPERIPEVLLVALRL